MRQAARAAAAVFGLALTLACSALEQRVEAVRGRTPAARAHLAVEVWSGFTQRPGAFRGGPERVEILLDLSTSMRARTAGGPPRYAAARTAALRLVRSLPPQTSVAVRALGVTKGDDACAKAFVVQRPTRGADPDALAPLLASLRPASESSLADAMDHLSQDVGPDGGRGLEGTRVVLVTDLGAECGGDLCAAAERLVAGGARLDLVLLSDVVVPQCFAKLAPPDEPQVALLESTPSRTTFRVEAHEAGSNAVGDVIGRGNIDGTPITVPPGAASIVLEMRPPSLIGPLVLEPGTLTRVRMLDFPTLDPPVREWRWDVDTFVPDATEP